MELNVPTIAQRKAARRNQNSQSPSQESSPASLIPEQIENPSYIAQTQENKPAGSLKLENASDVPLSAEAMVPETHIDKDTLIALARSMGLELTAKKKLWIKHSYSVTPESKEKFTNYCDVLGIKMQDGLEEAFQDWFKKKEVEFQAVSNAKKT